MISNTENVARAIFSPRMIYNGELQTEAFQLREAIGEEYLSVMRMSVPTWENDMMQIPQRRNRKLYGYAEMNVGSIREASFLQVTFDVRECDNAHLKSHAGIFTTIAGSQLVAGRSAMVDTDFAAQDYLLLMIQRRLVEIARHGLHAI